ncbi:MAG: UDP-3-O-(3-hydroxymyristoyl)glucosamine N-acyltransferase, partial [Bacteroidales bacterium]|nr:UDP-3-O-(3-hydroxymyristoyl)glucosamine N-acyltransferase [Bacteroidales bacterium]
MDEKLEMSAKQIAELTHGKLDGDGQIIVDKIVKLEGDETGGLTFANGPKYEAFIYTSKADIIIVYEDFVPKQPVKATLIRVKNPQLEIVRLLQYYDSLRPEKIGVSPRALIASTAKLGKNVYVGDGAVIGENVEIGDYAKIYPQTYLGDNVKVGAETILYAGVK